jgi:hypothetical protein
MAHSALTVHPTSRLDERAFEDLFDHEDFTPL